MHFTSKIIIHRVSLPGRLNIR